MSKDPGYRQNVYKALKAKVGGFDKSEEEFNNALNDPNYQKNVYKALKSKVGGFDKSEEEFRSLVLDTPIKKKKHYGVSFRTRSGRCIIGYINNGNKKAFGIFWFGR